MAIKATQHCLAALAQACATVAAALVAHDLPHHWKHKVAQPPAYAALMAIIVTQHCLAALAQACATVVPAALVAHELPHHLKQ